MEPRGLLAGFPAQKHRSASPAAQVTVLATGSRMPDSAAGAAEDVGAGMSHFTFPK